MYPVCVHASCGCDAAALAASSQQHSSKIPPCTHACSSPGAVPYCHRLSIACVVMQPVGDDEHLLMVTMCVAVRIAHIAVMTTSRHSFQCPVCACPLEGHDACI